MSVSGQHPRCLGCNSLERHRFVRAVFQNIWTEDFKSLRTLQFSRDPSVKGDWFESHEFSVYGGRNSLDLEAINRPDSSYDVVIFNHVLEHVADDHTAVVELFRITSDDGFVFLTFPNPIYRAQTRDWGYPDENLHGHYRHYGADVVQMFRSVVPQAFAFSHKGIDPVTRTADIAYFLCKSGARMNNFIARLTDCEIIRQGNEPLKSPAPRQVSGNSEMALAKVARAAPKSQ